VPTYDSQKNLTRRQADGTHQDKAKDQGKATGPSQQDQGSNTKMAKPRWQNQGGSTKVAIPKHDQCSRDQDNNSKKNK
jgi:hypothetical protein